MVERHLGNPRLRSISLIFHRLTVFFGNSKSADPCGRGGSTPPPGTNKTKGLDSNSPLENERPFFVGGCSDGCWFLRKWPNGCLPALWSAMNRRERHSPDSRSIAEVGSASRPRIRAPLRGRRALTPTPEPRQIISTSGECYQRANGLLCAGSDPLHHGQPVRR